MKKMVKVALLLMAVLTVIYTSVVAYAYVNSSQYGNSSGYKHPTEYGIWRHYFAEKLETEPEEWYTPEELGIILVESDIEGRFHIYIVDEEKAFPWMRDDEFTPYAVKYEGEFYQILGLWVTPALPEYVRQSQIPVGVALGAGWVFTGASFLKGRKKI